jgi:hypothetical protein
MSGVDKNDEVFLLEPNCVVLVRRATFPPAIALASRSYLVYCETTLLAAQGTLTQRCKRVAVQP